MTPEEGFLEVVVPEQVMSNQSDFARRPRGREQDILGWKDGRTKVWKEDAGQLHLFFLSG